MKRSQLRNKFLNTRSNLDRKAYNKQSNYVVSLLRKEKNCYSNLNTNVLTENRTFWKTVKLFLTDKTNFQNNFNRGRERYLPRSSKSKNIQQIFHENSN